MLDVRESPKFRVSEEIGVEEHDSDVRFRSGSGNMAVSCMRNASGHNYRNSSVIVDLAMWQTFTKRISSCYECLSCSSFSYMPIVIKIGVD